MRYEIRTMWPHQQGKFYCSRKNDMGHLCTNKATLHLVVKPDSGRGQRRYARCEDCARLDAAAFIISMPKEPVA